jgi:ferredoxin, 2Fe-2S
MPHVVVTDQSGGEEILDFRPGDTLMQTITGAGMSELLALCGGMCACATCHVYVDSEFGDALPAMSHDEDELLGPLIHRRENSRLSCQIRLNADLDGLRATIAPGD